MTKDKVEEFVVVYETCPRSKFGPGRDWSWQPALSPEDAIKNFKETHDYLVKEQGICMLHVAKVIKLQT